MIVGIIHSRLLANFLLDYAAWIPKDDYQML